jgi:hypothetical protein
MPGMMLNMKIILCTKNKFAITISLLVVFFVSCKKENDFVYEVNDVNVKQSGAEKNNAKSTTEFITIAYSDLFGNAISQADLVKLNTVYAAFGDKKLIEDRIIRNFLNNSGVQIPSAVSVNGDTTKFIIQVYKKFYNREPNAFEAYYLKEQFRLNNSFTPLVVYYAFMTSDEYRYY